MNEQKTQLTDLEAAVKCAEAAENKLIELLSEYDALKVQNNHLIEALSVYKRINEKRCEKMMEKNGRIYTLEQQLVNVASERDKLSTECDLLKFKLTQIEGKGTDDNA